MQDVIKIFSFDGQSIWLDFKTEIFEVGNFLGGGAAGNVYECEHIKSRERYALKVLNPLGYKITASSVLQKFVIISKGEVFNDSDKTAVVCREHVWWVMNNTTKQYLACYYVERGSSIRELSLSQCMSIWGTDIPGVSDEANVSPEHTSLRPTPGAINAIPLYPPKYVEFLRKRDRIFREIRNMRKISAHPNVIRLEAVLEHIQDSKCTIFLVMELANGGELFDRIKTDCGTCEDTAKYFFWQLLQGVMHCHNQGVCHRDLKPENLLLQGEGKDSILKVLATTIYP
jgi:serine/threonine protein kinase